MTTYDVLVAGLGGAGSSAAFHLAREGERVLGLERFAPVHAHGSSHGRSRIYRTAYFEGPEYVPLLLRAQELWRELQTSTPEPIVRPTGGLMIGRPDTPTVAGALRTAEQCRLPHELLDAATVASRFPQFDLRSEESALFDPNAGVLYPENCLRAQSAGAVEAGAELHYGEPLVSWTASARGITVRTRTAEYRARSLVLTTGAWTRGVVRDLRLPLEIERQFMFWFPANEPELVSADRMPVFLWDAGDEFQTYGVPDVGDGVKVGSWRGKFSRTPERADRELHQSDAAPVRAFAAERLRGVRAREREVVSCLYTNAPDRHFVLGPHPKHPNVVVVSACSGHGFKFMSVLGEVVARLATGEAPGFELGLFDPGRFGRRPRSG